MTTTIRQSMNFQDWWRLIALSILWGGSFFFVGIAVKALTPLTIVLIRLSLAALMLWVVVRLLNVPLPATIKAWFALLVMGILNNVIPFSLIVWGQTHIESGLASIFNAMTPLFTVLVAGMLLVDERISRAKIIGVLLGISGAAVMVGADAIRGMSTDVLAQLAVMGAAVSYGFSTVWGRRFKTLGLNPIAVAAGQVTLSAVILAPLAFIIEKPLTQAMPGTQVWAALIALAVFSTALAYILFFRVLASAGATNVSLVTFLVPVSAILLGFVFLGERLELTHFAGMLLIALGLSAIDGRLWRKTPA
ncbi:MAG: DMT family transporter [Granulosicoccus sp.]